MASNEFTALCAVASFLWLFYSLQGHNLVEQPRLSSLLLLLTASLVSFIASLFPRWVSVGFRPRYDDDLGLRGGGDDSHVDKPRRRFLITLVTCVAVRLELFHRISTDLQCSTPGIESFLPLLILLFEMGRTKVRDENIDDMGETIYEAIGRLVHDFLTDSHHFYILSILMLSLGASLATSQTVPSTFFCSNFDPGLIIIWFQWAGLLLDCAIVILSWRLFAWTRTTEARLKTLSSILLASAAGTGLFLWVPRIVQSSRPMSYGFEELGSLSVLDLAVDGLAFSVFLIFSTQLVADGKPLPLVGVFTFLAAIIPAIQRVKVIGSWENLSPATTIVSFGLLCVGFILFIFAGNIRSVLLVRRTILALILVVVFITTTIYAIAKGHQTFNDHPLRRLIYDSRVGANRWLVEAATSNSLIVAVREYQARHHGRDPPAKFDAWYDFASVRYSPIVDHFTQIESDLLPFWGLPPQKIREDIARLSSEPGIAIVKIKAGQASHNLDANSPEKGPLDDLVEMINTFAEHIPDMELAINTNQTPRVLAPWGHVQSSISRGEGARLTRHSKRDAVPLPVEEKKSSASLFYENEATGPNPLQSVHTPVEALRELTALACPSRTAMRSGVRWNTRDFCSSCAKPQSQGGHYPTNWALYQELCHQPDLLRLHSFHMTSPELPPLQELVPVFSRSKTESYRDILIPLKRADEQSGKEEDPKDFAIKKKVLFWRGSVDRGSSSSLTTSQHDLLHGGHQERLVYLVNNNGRNNNNTNIHERTTLILPESMVKINGEERLTYTFQQIPFRIFNNLLPFDVAFTNYTGPNKGDMTIKSPSRSSSSSSPNPADVGNPDGDNDEQLTSQYVLTIDTDSGSPSDFLTVLRSKSVPFYGSIFKEWYTERLMPWVHYVPVDLRWHALHSTLAYFTGIDAHAPPQTTPPPRPAPVEGGKKKETNKGGGGDEKGKDNGPAAGAAAIRGKQIKKRSWQGMPGNGDQDGKWIAEEGMKWASKALRREDMEIYLFRLLLEWARIVSDDRDRMSFVL